jgi:ketosteroid isomerase-like protein
MPPCRHAAMPLRPLAWFLAVSLSACGAPQTVAITDRAQIVEAVSGRLGLWARAVNNRSLDTLDLLYAHTRDLAVAWPEGDQTRGWIETSARWKRWAESLTQLNFLIQSTQVDVLDREVAVATFRFSSDIVVGDQRTRQFGPVTQVWARDRADDKWKIRFEHRSVVR